MTAQPRTPTFANSCWFHVCLATADPEATARKADRQMMQKIRATEIAGQGKVTSELTVAVSK
jgi:hypothetical protein